MISAAAIIDFGNFYRIQITATIFFIMLALAYHTTDFLTGQFDSSIHFCFWVSISLRINKNFIIKKITVSQTVEKFQSQTERAKKSKSKACKSTVIEASKVWRHTSQRNVPITSTPIERYFCTSSISATRASAVAYGSAQARFSLHNAAIRLFWRSDAVI